MKDPAFLFYSQDFFTGVATLTWEDRGKYITLLCLMHQQGRMSEETIRFLVGTVSDNLRSKFSIDEGGLWYNKRLELEATKRNAFTESRRNNGSLGGRPKSETKIEPKQNLQVNHTDKRMEDVSENVNAVVTEDKKRAPAKAKKNKPTVDNDTTWPTFDDFWNAGLAKIGKEKVIPKWYTLKQDDKVEIMGFIPKYLRSTEFKYLRRPPAFINGKTWKDEIIDRTDAKRIAAAGSARKNTNSAAVIDQQVEYRADF